MAVSVKSCNCKCKGVGYAAFCNIRPGAAPCVVSGQNFRRAPCLCGKVVAFRTRWMHVPVWSSQASGSTRALQALQPSSQLEADIPLRVLA